MRALLLLILLWFTLFTQAQIQSNCNVPLVLQNNYDEDVKHLALQRIYSLNSTYKDSILIPQSFQDTIWEGLAAIFNLTIIPERDSVFDKYCIHHHNLIIYHFITISVDTTYAWTSQWKTLNTITGITALDSLLATYGFQIVGFTSLSKSSFGTFFTTQKINVMPLCDSLKFFAGINYSEAVSYIGDGNAIIYDKSGTDEYFNFDLGYGDCPSGCTSEHIFLFKVYDNCSVDYLGTFDYITSGDRMPLPVNCNITTAIEKITVPTETLLSPNPFYTTATLEIKNKEFSNAELKIYDRMGRLVQRQIINSPSTIIHRNLLADGIYFYQLVSDKGQMVGGKFVVE